jgi:sugar/nucleoside kinase (ribokinase family)
LLHIPAYDVEVVGTTGAGDAHLSGVLAGLSAGLSLGEAHQLGALAAARSVSCPDTIDKGLDRFSLRSLADRAPAPLTEGVRRLLE